MNKILVYLAYYLSAFLLAIGASIYIQIWAIVQLLVRLFGYKKLAVVIDDAMYASYQRYILFFFEVITGVKVVVYGDFEDISNRQENVILFSNHQCLVDWVVVAMLAERVNSSGFMRFVLKQSLKYIPLYGYYFKQHGFLYVERSGNFKQGKFTQQLDQLSEHPCPLWLTLFPEGHRYNSENIHALNKMRQYAKDHDLPVYENLLTPRTKAFSICAEKLAGKMDAVYDTTVAFSSTLPRIDDVNLPSRLGSPSYFDLFKGGMTIHIHVTRIPMSQVPTTGKDFDDWLFSRYSVKDKLVEDFYSKSSNCRGTFGSGGKTSKLSLSRIIPTAVVYLACSVPLFCSWQLFQSFVVVISLLTFATFTVSALCY